MSEPHPLSDAHLPPEIARRVEEVGVAKARSDTLTLLVLAVLAGAFIALGAVFYTVVVTRSAGGFGLVRLAGGVSFSLGLILVVVAGAELFTGNNLLAMAWASRRITTGEVLRNWGIVYLGNMIGAIGTAALVLWADLAWLADGSVGDTAMTIARSKAALAPGVAFARGVLCNALVCLAVWLAMGGRSVTDRILAVIFPITAFVAIGAEHSIANWFFLPYGLAVDGLTTIHPFGALRNLVMVTLGNIAGGTLLVAGVYWLAYLRGSRGDGAAS